jgi:type I restriction enzyme M protein
VKANVLFFDRKPANQKPCTETALDLRPAHNQYFTLKEKTLKRTNKVREQTVKIV